MKHHWDFLPAAFSGTPLLRPHALTACWRPLGPRVALVRMCPQIHAQCACVYHTVRYVFNL